MDVLRGSGHGPLPPPCRAWALLGLLIERHLPPGDGADEKAMLTNLAQGWGIGALLAALGRRPDH
ncbi:MAG: hypothetical protein IT458_16535 [Planctomycetes bacterium]|nr:hypothetical protein [Planctomycetota bacterium]